MSDLTLFTKKEVLTFIDLFEENTTKLVKPMIAWLNDGAYTIEEARIMVVDGFIPEGVKMCALGKTDDYWDSVEIIKEEDGSYEISTGQMPGSKATGATEIDEALVEAQNLLIEFINEN